MKPILLLLFIFISTAAYSIEYDYSLIPYRKGDKWGYTDKDKKIIIPLKFERAYFFTPNGLARVLRGGKYGFINKEGKFKIEPKFDKAKDFYFSGAQVEIKGDKFCCDENGELTPSENKSIFDCSNTFMASEDAGICGNCCKQFMINGKYGTVCKDLNYRGGKWNLDYYDSIPAMYDTIISFGYNEGHSTIEVKQNGKWGVINSKNHILLPIKYDETKVVEYNLVLVKTMGLWQLVDTTGRIIKDGATEVNEMLFSEGHYFTMKIDGYWGVFFSDGTTILKPQFDSILLTNQMIISCEFVLKQNGLYGFIDKAGFIPIQYESMECFDGNPFTLIRKKGKEGYVSRAGKEYFED